jgi:hypothetical protein
MSGSKQDFSGRLADITAALALELRVANTEELAQTCFPGDLEEIFNIAQKSFDNLLDPATARIQILKAIALAEKVLDRLRDKTCQQAASITSKNSQQKALAAMRKLSTGERALFAFKMYERAHTALAALVCQKGMGLKVSRHAPPHPASTRTSTQRQIPLAEEQRRRAAVFAEQKALAEKAGVTLKQNDVNVKNAEFLLGEEERSGDEDDSNNDDDDNDDEDDDDSWLVSDDSDDDDQVADMKNMPDENDPELKRIHAQFAQVALKRQQKDVADAEARLAHPDIDEEEREALENRIFTIQTKDIREQKQIIDNANGVLVAPAKSVATPLVKRRIVPTLISAAPATASALAVAPAPVPTFSFFENASISKPRELSENGKRTPEQWATWVKRIKKGKVMRRKSGTKEVAAPEPKSSSSSDVIFVNEHKHKQKKRRGSALQYQVVCDGNKCVRKPQEVIIIGSSSDTT